MDTRNYCVECDMSKPCECKDDIDDAIDWLMGTLEEMLGITPDENK